jgi:hypothetical protein
MREKRSVYIVLVGRPEGVRVLGRPRCRWGDLWEVGWFGLNLSGWGQRPVAGSCETVWKFRYHKILGISCLAERLFGFTRRTELHGVSLFSYSVLLMELLSRLIFKTDFVWLLCHLLSPHSSLPSLYSLNRMLSGYTKVLRLLFLPFFAIISIFSLQG